MIATTIVDVYQSDYKRILREGAIGEGPLLTEIEASRQRALAEVLISQRRAFESVSVRIGEMRKTLDSAPHLGTMVTLSATDFQVFNSRNLPALNLPAIFSMPLPVPALDVILLSPLLVDLKDEVYQIIEDSELSGGTPFFRTIRKNGRAAIFGSNHATLASLSGLAHELGHCLLERRASCLTRKTAILSETVAQILEEALVSEFLKSSGQDIETWAWYQRKLDGLNLHFFEVESGSESQFFSSASYVFRDSLFFNPGYQLVYANASLNRLNYLLKRPSATVIDGQDWQTLWRDHLDLLKENS
jgi:hypothetical protein